MENKCVKNVIILSFCVLVSKFIGAFYKIFLSNILGSRGIGIYYLIFPVYSFFLVFITGGITTYVSQKISTLKVKNDNKKIQNLLNSCFVFVVLLGILFSILLCVFSKTFALFQENIDAMFGYIIISFSIIFSGISSVIKGYFQGLENMRKTSFSNIFEQLSKLIFGIILSSYLLKFGIKYAIIGAIVAVDISEIIVFFYLIISYKTTCKSHKFYICKYSEIKQTFVEFLPISLSNLILPLSSFVDSFLVVNLLIQKGLNDSVSTSLYGISSGMINPIINFPVILCGTIATAILPSLSNKISRGEDVVKSIENAINFVWLLCVPCVLGIMFLAKYIMPVFFPVIENSFLQISIYYLTIVSTNILWLNISQISSSILNSLGKFKLPLYCQMAGFFVKIILFVCLMLFTNLGIISLAISSVLGNSVCCIFMLYFVKKNFEFSAQSKKIVLPVVFAGFMYFVLMLLDKIIMTRIIIKMLILTLFAVAVYFALCVLFGVFTLSDIKCLFIGRKKLKNIS